MAYDSQYSFESDPSECSLSSNSPVSERNTETEKMNSMKPDKLQYSVDSDPEECPLLSDVLAYIDQTGSFPVISPKRKRYIEDLDSSPLVKRGKLQESPVMATPLEAKPEELFGDDDDYVEEDGVEFQYYWYDPVPDATDDEEEEVPLDDMKSDKLEYSIESDPEECPSPSNHHVGQKSQTNSSVSIESDPEECPLSPNHDPVTEIRKKSISMESDAEECSTSWNKNSLVAATSLQTKPDELRSDDGLDQNYAEEVASNSVSIPDSFDGKEDDVESRYNAYNEDTEDYSFYYWCYSDAEDEVQSEWRP